MPQNESRNMITFMVIAFAILIGYQALVLDPANKKRQLEAKQAAAATAAAKPQGPKATSGPSVRVSRDAAKARSPRVTIATPALSGSLRLQGARIDDLFLTERGPNGLKYAQSLKKGAPPVELLRPEGAANAWFADFGWEVPQVNGVPVAVVPGLPTADTVWTVTSGDVLAPGKPLVLTYVAPGRLVFTRRVEVDDRFMFTVTDTVANLGAVPVTLNPYARVQRQGLPVSAAQNVHEGGVGALSDMPDREKPELRLFKYKPWKKKTGQTFSSQGGWLGITDKYWLAALVPTQSEKIVASFNVSTRDGVDIYDANYGGTPRLIAPGKQVTEVSRLYAGAKVVKDLQAYQKTLGIPFFDKAVDWGVLGFLTRPFFNVLEFFFSHVGNFGLAILATTLVVRLLLFPLAQKSYESMSRMKKLQKPMEEIRARYKEDPAKMQQETMALYQREKVNPMLGCLPILLQIPIFLAFYKVLSVTIEMRHAPFYGYIRDLSDRDPTTVLNLFGLIPWDIASTPLIGGFLNGPLHLGVLPLLYGFTMWLTTAMNPPAPDPMQQRIFQLMPIMFTFIMAPFAVGLLLYWTFSNVFSIFQQYIIMHRLKTDNPIDDFIARVRGNGKAV
ncbi:MAG: membrane protein insertase YidC [Caulobacter sp.]|nr:membrane protein insertase YidC [Caulobacter sp.]